MNQLIPLEHENVEDFLWRLGSLKEAGAISFTWPELATIFNEYAEEDHTESYWRKQYRQMRLDRDVQEAIEIEEQEAIAQQPSNLRTYLREIEKRRVLARDERVSYTRTLRDEARKDAVVELFREEIRRAEPPVVRERIKTYSDKAVYAMISDIHYGLTFDNYAGHYDSRIAEKRVMKYAQHIVRIGESAGADTCYVSLMGDLISGNIHTTIRIENRENIIQQVVGVSELIAAFLYYLAEHFETVIVNSVDGNHSRTEAKAEDALRAEKLDALVPWYCKTKLEQLSNVAFNDNLYDPTIGRFNIFNKTYICVHGDMDNDLKSSVNRIERMTNQKIDYILAAHLHVPEMRMEDVGYIRNGSVCGSGDEYTVKKRLFSPAAQVCMVVSEQGVESLHSVAL